MHRILINALVSAFATATLADVADAQLHRTKRVDRSGATGFFDTIQGAIDDIGVPITEQWTILIYAGEYAEEVILDEDHGMVDLVGVDPDGVIIKPPADKDAITIKGVGARNNTIQNLTIIADDDTDNQGRGIVIAKEGTGDDPSAIKIIGVTIKTLGDDSDGISFSNTATDIEIRDTTIDTIDGHGIEMSDGIATAPANVSLNTVTINAGGTGYSAINGANASNVTLFNCILESDAGDAVKVGRNFIIVNNILNGVLVSDPAQTPADALREDADSTSQHWPVLVLPWFYLYPFAL